MNRNRMQRREPDNPGARGTIAWNIRGDYCPPDQRLNLSWRSPHGRRDNRLEPKGNMFPLREGPGTVRQ